MKKLTSILLLSCAFAYNSFSQRMAQEDLGTLLLSKKWYCAGEFGNKNSIYFVSKPEGKALHWDATFLGTDKGKFMRCDSAKQDVGVVPETGQEEIIKYDRYACDSSMTYVVRGNKVRFISSGTSYYYRLIKLPQEPKEKREKLELAILDPQQFYR
jgi:hypothetical protein